MTLRTKLVGAFLLMATLVAVLGWVAVNRIDSINGDVTVLSQDAIPTALVAKDLDALQHEQQRAVFAYFASGAAEERQRYDALVPRVDQKLAELTRAVGNANAEAGPDPVTQIADDRVRFDAAARELIDARASIEQNVETVRVKGEEMVVELTLLRHRFAPTATSAAEEARIPQALQTHVSKMLFGMEGMMSIVGFEAALSSGYAITLNPLMRQRFEDASAAWANFLETAKANAGPDDRVILARVERKFVTEFEPSARSLIATAQSAARARTTFVDAGTGISNRVEQVVTTQTDQLAEAQAGAQATASGTRRAMIAVALIAFALASGFGIWFAGTFTRPLRQLRDLADRVSRGELEDVEIEVRTRDEVGDLAGAFHRMVVSLRFLMRSGDAEVESGSTR